MSISQIHLRKILRIMYAQPNRQISLLRNDIREDLAKEAGVGGGGGDFYGPFWRDAKDHATGIGDLHSAVEGRISANKGRSELYLRLRDGFLTWWNERRRWTNEPFQPLNSPKSRLEIPDLAAVIKIENFLAVVGSKQDRHFVYPYFSPDPVLNQEAARLGLWAMAEAAVIPDPTELRILDVIRGQTFGLKSAPLRGNEKETFVKRYRNVKQLRDQLMRQY